MEYASNAKANAGLATAIIDNAWAMAQTAGTYSPKQLEQIKTALDARKAAILNADYAGDIIALFKGLRNTGNARNDLAELNAVYNVTAPETAGQRKILGK